MADGLRVSFRHQTLFDHAVARAFVEAGERLLDYVRIHQDSLFPRPRIWSVLTYLREAAPETYRRELEAIWTLPGLRLHLRHLLLDFLGSRSDPGALEQRLLLPCFDDDGLAMKAARVTAGNRAWFAIIAAHKLGDLMVADPPRRHAAVALLRLALPFARPEAVRLMARNWTETRLPQRIDVLVALNDWDDDAVALARPLATAEEIADASLCWLATTMGASRPDDAAALVVERLKWRTTPLMEADRRAAAEPREDGTDAWARSYAQTATCKALERPGDWYELAAIAQAAPVTFFHLAGSWFLEAMEFCTWGNHRNYRLSRLHFEIRADTGLPQNEVLAAMLATMRGYAARDPAGFVAASAAWRASNIDICHRLMARALEELAAVRPDLVVDYLTEEPRRLQIGNDLHSARHLESCRLIARVCSASDQPQIDRLFASVQVWSPPQPEWYAEEVDRRRQWAKNVREERLELLTAFPPEVLDDARRRWIAEEERACTGFRPEPESDAIHIMSIVTSPMSADDMVKADDDDIIAFMTKYAAASAPGIRHGLDHDHHTVNSAFAEFSKSAPARAAAILDRLPVGGFSKTLDYALRNLGAGLPRDEFFAFARHQMARGHGGIEFVRSLALVCTQKAEQPDGLPDDLLALFAASLTDAEEAVDADNPPSAKKEEVPSAILWPFGLMAGVPHGNYPLLSALWWGYLMKDPPRADDGLGPALDQLDRRERAETWRHFILFDLPKNFRFCSPDLARRFIDTLLTRYPQVAAGEGAALLVAHTWSWSAPPEYLRWAEMIRASGWSRGGQAFGELVGLRHLLQPEDATLVAVIDNLLANFADERHGERTGLAFAAANEWGEPEFRRAAARLLGRLAAAPDADTAHAVMDAFRNAPTPLPGDEATRIVLADIASGETLARARPEPFLVSALSDVVAVWPEEVHAVARAVVEHGDRHTGWRADSHELVHISLALQRLGEQWRGPGLTLFEDLLRAEAAGVEDVLADLDGGRQEKDAPAPRRLRRRRR